MTTIKLPKRIEIGGFTYTFICGETVEEQLREDGDSGQCDYRRNQLKVAKSANPQRRQFTIIHELIHAISWEYGRADDLKEAQVDSLAQGLCQLFKQIHLKLVFDE